MSDAELRWVRGELAVLMLRSPGNPRNDAAAVGDPYKTLFIARLVRARNAHLPHQLG